MMIYLACSTEAFQRKLEDGHIMPIVHYDLGLSANVWLKTSAVLGTVLFLILN